MNIIDEDFFEKIKLAWSKDTCYPPLKDKWTEEIPELGHCAVTALLIHENYGGKIAYNNELHHYWNVLPNGIEFDLTKNQFGNIDKIQIDGYREREYFFTNEDTVKRYELLKNKL